MHPSLSLCLLLAALPAIGGPPEESFSRGREKAFVDASRIIAELDPLVKELDVLRDEEARSSDPAPFRAARKRLRRRIDELVRELMVKHKKHLRLTRQKALFEAVGVVKDVVSKTPQKTDPRLNAVFQATEMEHSIGEAKRRALFALRDEESAARALEQRSQEHEERKHILHMLAAFGLAVCSLLAAVWRLREKARGPEVLSETGGSPGPLPCPAPQPAPMLGPYRLLEAAEESPFGSSCSAEGPGGRKVLLRLVDAAPTEEPERAIFLAAVGRAAALRHPNLAPMRPVADDPSRFAVSFDCWPSRSLRHFLDQKRLQPLWSRQLLVQTARGLACGHAAGVVHGGLTPDDIRILEDGVVLVAGLGIGSALRTAWGRTGSHRPAGAPAYLAPEQEVGADRPESDVFALGVILYEMATGGALPFPGPNFPVQKRERGWRPPSALSPGWPRGLDALVSKALDPSPAQRYPSAGALIAALESLR